MTDIATIGIRADFSDLDDAERALESFAGEAQRTATTVQRAGQTMTRGLSGVGKAAAPAATGLRALSASAGNLGPRIQMASYQIQDIVTQLSMGTRASVTLSQQLPQLAASFGGMGALAGLAISGVVMALGPLIDGLFKIQNEADAANDALDELAGTVKTMEGAIKALDTPMGDLIEKYGMAAGKVREMQAALAELSILEATRDARDAAKAVAELGADIDGWGRRKAVSRRSRRKCARPSRCCRRWQGRLHRLAG